MRKPQGYATLCEPDKAPVECDTFTCAHCNHIVHVKPRAAAEDIGGLCKVCMGMICGPCVNLLVCDVFEKKLERMEARDRFLRQAVLQ